MQIHQRKMPGMVLGKATQAAAHIRLAYGERTNNEGANVEPKPEPLDAPLGPESKEGGGHHSSSPEPQDTDYQQDALSAHAPAICSRQAFIRPITSAVSGSDVQLPDHSDAAYAPE